MYTAYTFILIYAQRQRPGRNGPQADVGKQRLLAASCEDAVQVPSDDNSWFPLACLLRIYMFSSSPACKRTLTLSKTMSPLLFFSSCSVWDRPRGRAGVSYRIACSGLGLTHVPVPLCLITL